MAPLPMVRHSKWPTDWPELPRRKRGTQRPHDPHENAQGDATRKRCDETEARNNPEERIDGHDRQGHGSSDGNNKAADHDAPTAQSEVLAHAVGSQNGEAPPQREDGREGHAPPAESSRARGRWPESAPGKAGDGDVQEAAGHGRRAGIGQGQLLRVPRRFRRDEVAMARHERQEEARAAHAGDPEHKRRCARCRSRRRCARKAPGRPRRARRAGSKHDELDGNAREGEQMARRRRWRAAGVARCSHRADSAADHDEHEARR